MRLLYGGGRAGLLDGGTRSRVYWEGDGGGVDMGLYYANQSFVEFRTMILGIHVYVYIPPSSNPAPLLHIKDACQMWLLMVFLSIHQPEDDHKRRNM
jgi:hypothetical protein